MRTNLERQFTRLAVAKSTYETELEAARSRYSLLFDALAIRLGYDRSLLAAQLGFDPVPRGGNAIMNGKAEAMTEDVLRLLERYLQMCSGVNHGN